MLTLVQPAGYFVPNLVVRVMEEHIQDNELMGECIMLLSNYINLIIAVQASCDGCTEPGHSPTLVSRAKTLRKFDVVGAKAVLSTCMQHEDGYLRNDCIRVLEDLIPLEFFA
jgi:hypothetical protein